MMTELKEFKADHENSAVAEPVATGDTHKNRKADKAKNGQLTADSVVDLIGINKGGKLIPDDGKVANGEAPARLADNRSQKEPMKGVKESIDELFDGSELSEEFKEKAAVIFEAVVVEKLAEAKEALEEDYKAQFEIVKEALAEKIGSYLDYMAEEFLSENEVAIETNAKVAVAESFMEGFKNLFIESNVAIPESIDVVEGLEAKIAELTKSLNESEAKNIELSKVISEAETSKSVAEIVNEASEGLTESQKDRLSTLVEGIQYTSADELKSKIDIIKESIVAKKEVKGEELLNEEFNAPKDETPVVDARMQSYLAATSRILKK